MKQSTNTTGKMSLCQFCCFFCYLTGYVSVDKGGIILCGYVSVRVVGIAETKYEYNGKNELVAYTDPEGRTETYTYDVNGNHTKTVDKNGNTLAMMFPAVSYSLLTV